MAQRYVISIGNFDGIHLGHQGIMARARHLADRLESKVVALAFDPHPARVLRPDCEPPCLIEPECKIDALRRAGADDVQVLDPTPAFLNQDPEAFVRWLMDRFYLSAIVEGSNFRFGKDRKGDVDQLRAMGGRFGFQVHVVEPVEVVLADQQLVTVSSTLIRWLVDHGRVEDAARCLGRPYRLSGRVVVGAKRGRMLGVPTANLDLNEVGQLLPADAVYAGRVELEGAAVFPAAISVGVKPTFSEDARTVEAHILDFQGDLYGKPIVMEPLRWLRDQHRFPSLNGLKSQLGRDIERTRWLADQLA